MYPAINPPPLKDSEPNREPPPSLREMLLYCICGALIGSGIGGFVVGIDYTFRWVTWKQHEIAFQKAEEERDFVFLLLHRHWISIEPTLDGDQIIRWTVGLFFAGIPSGFVLWLAAVLWPPSKHPIRAASLCVSLGGTLMLLLMGGILATHRVHNQALIRIAVVTATTIFLCGLFGFVHALIVRRAISWLASWQTRSDPIAY